MLRYMAIAFFALMLAGCVSPEEQRAMDQDKCSSFGFAQGTDAFANCMMQQDSQRADLEQRQWEADERADAERSQQRSRDNYIDPTPQYDRDGNPNFDTQGNYQGCHGIGCEVDTPDDS
ncbi:hypothetical protein [Paramesorhizobium deserti]